MVTCHMSHVIAGGELRVFSGKTLAYILLCPKKKTKLEVSCGKKNQPAVNFQHTEISRLPSLQPPLPWVFWDHFRPS